MSYINITQTIIIPVEQSVQSRYVDINFIHPERASFLEKEVLVRASYFLLAPASLITCALDIIVGLGAGLGVIWNLGKNPQTFKITCNHLLSSKLLLVKPYVNLLKTINPEAKFSSEKSYLWYRPAISADGDGFLTDLIISPLKELGRNCCKSNNYLKRNVASRLAYGLLAISCLVTRAFDAVIGVGAASLSIFTRGKFEDLNNLAFRALQAPGIINDLFYCLIKSINPRSGHPTLTA